MKRCPSCERQLPPEAFNKDSRTKDGLRCYCRECSRAKAKDRYYAEPIPDEVREQRRRRALEWYHANKERATANRRASQRRHPERRAAQKAAWQAMSRGQLVRKPCEVCGAEEVEGHHDDYSKPLEVRWLCRVHHADADMERRRREREAA